MINEQEEVMCEFNITSEQRTVFITEDGAEFGSYAEAKQHQAQKDLRTTLEKATYWGDVNSDEVADFLVKNADSVIQLIRNASEQ